jgi:hypothetical protein
MLSFLRAAYGFFFIILLFFDAVNSVFLFEIFSFCSHCKASPKFQRCAEPFFTPLTPRYVKVAGLVVP